VGARSPELSGTVPLRDGRAVVETGITDTGCHLNVCLDPTGNCANDSSVSVRSDVRWDAGAGEYCVDITEQGTDVGDPDIGYRIWQQ
jgi:hypothetical protein